MSTEIQVKAKDFFAKDMVKQKFAEIMGKNSTSFITSVLQIVSSNDKLSVADPNTIYHAAMVAATLQLPINNNLGFAYIVPYQEKQKDGSYITKAQFQMGWKGYVQLAQRSGQVKKINVAEIYDGEILSSDPLVGYVFDFSKRGTPSQSNKIVGYAARLELLNGFESIFFMTSKQLEIHGKTYSKTFDNAFGRWKQDFDGMAKKTVIKQLISKFAPLSVDMQKAILVDQAVINNEDATDISYVDNDNVAKPSLTMSNKDKERQRLCDFINNATSKEQLETVYAEIDDETEMLYQQKLMQLTK